MKQTTTAGLAITSTSSIHIGHGLDGTKAVEYGGPMEVITLVPVSLALH